MYTTGANWANIGLNVGERPGVDWACLSAEKAFLGVRRKKMQCEKARLDCSQIILHAGNTCTHSCR